MEPIFDTVSAQWYDRPGTLRECTEQVLDFVNKLKDHNPTAFGAWYKLAWSKKKALESKVEFSYEGTKKLLLKHVRKGDLYILREEEKFFLQEGSVPSMLRQYKDEVYTELSYGVYTWNGLDGFEGGSLSISIGSPYGNRGWSNNCILYLPKAGETHEYYQIPANQQALIKLLSEFWHPDYIQVNGERI